MGRNFVISIDASAREALRKLDLLGITGVALFAKDENDKVVGSITDGDIRRGLIRNLHIDDAVSQFMNRDFHYLLEHDFTNKEVLQLKQLRISFVPLVKPDGSLVRIIDISGLKSFLPVHVMLMAGGKGERLRPLTLNTPKPMLLIGDKPIIEHNIDRLIQYGVEDITISVCYLKDQIMEYFGNGSQKGVTITYVEEDIPLGTLGAVASISEMKQDHVLVMNADILTNVDFEDMFNWYKSNAALMCAASIPYKVQIPYGIMQVNGSNAVTGLAEKPNYTYYANAGIYLFQKQLIEQIPKRSFYNATDLMQFLIDTGQSLIHYPILQYWLDIGRYDDFIRAQQDYKHISF